MYYLLENADYPAFQILPLRCILASLCWRHSQVSGDSLWLFTFEREAVKATRGCRGGCLWAGYGWRAVMQGDLYTCLEVSFGDPRMLRSWRSFPWSVGPSREDNSCSVSRWKRGQGLPAAPELALVILLTWWITMTCFLMLNPLDHDEFFLVYCWNGFADALLRISVSVLTGAIFL